MRKLFSNPILLSLLFLALIINFNGEKTTKLIGIEDKKITENINQKFEQLRAAPNENAANKIEAELYLLIGSDKSPNINLMLNEAMALEAKNQNAAALLLYKQICILDPQYAEGYNQAAHAFYKIGDKDMALKYLKTVTIIEPRYFSAWVGIGTLLEENGDYKGALAAYKEAQYWNPNLQEATRGIFRLESEINGIIM